ncbi:MAG: HEAT repeat domain-containing protein [Conexivisphaerales archaeon]
MGEIEKRFECASSSLKPFVLPTSYPHYPPDRQITITHIKIEITPDFNAQTISAKSTLTLVSKREGVSSLVLNLRDLQVHSIKDETGSELSFEHTGDDLYISLNRPAKKDERMVITVSYSGRPRKGLYFRKPDEYQPNRPLQLWTQGEDEDSHFWFPCIDFPGLKVTSEVIAHVPSSMTAISNGRLVEVKEEDGGMKSYHWIQDKPHSVYLISLVAGDYVEIREEVDGIPLYYYVYKGREEDAKRSFSETPKMVKFFQEKIGYRYPWDKYSQTVVSDFIFGGMENTSATTLTDTTLHDERAHIDFSSNPLVAHELAHMWFGDLLTCRHWKHGWLNESFATYFQLLYTEYSRGKDEFLMEQLDDFASYLEEYNSNYARPIATNVYETPSELFDRHLYEKGGLVLNMIRAKLGDEDFWRAINNYVSKNAFKAVETSDFARAIEEVTGISMDEFMDQWIFRPGHPELKISYSRLNETSSDGQRKAKLVVKQTQDAEPFKFDLKVKVADKSTSTIHLLTVSAKEQTFDLPLSADSKSLYISVDPDFQLLATIDFERPRQMIINQLKYDSTYGRIQAARSLGKDSSLDAVDALYEAMKGDEFWGVRAEAAKALGEIGNDYALEKLKEGLGDKHPKVRRAVVSALGKFKNEKSANLLIDLLKNGDESYFVEAEAAKSLGKTRQKVGFDTLLKALSKPSYNEVIQSGAIEGLANLGDERGLEYVIERTSKKYINSVRYAATLALGKLGVDKKEVRDLLIDLLSDDWFRVRAAAADSLVERKEFTAIDSLEKAVAREMDGRVKRHFREAISNLRSLQPTTAEIKSIRDELERVKEENRKILERLERLEKERN